MIQGFRGDMMIYRPVTLDDLGALEAFSKTLGVGTAGAFQTDRSGLEQVILHSMDSFCRPVHTPGDEVYVFVLWEETENELVGIYKLAAVVNGGRKFFSYQIRDVHQFSPVLGVDKSLPALFLVNELTGATLPSSQVLHPKYRGKGRYAYVLCSAFLFYIGRFPWRFPKRVIGEYRGCYDSQNRSLFWKHFVQRFSKSVDYTTYLQLLRNGLEEEVIGLLPKGPIFLELLSEEIQSTIGQTHVEAQPALKLNMRQGFQNTGHISYSSGAPILETCIQDLKQISAQQSAPIGDLVSSLHGPRFLMSNACSNLDFRVCYAPFVEEEDGSVTTTQQAARSLQLRKDERICYS